MAELFGKFEINRVPRWPLLSRLLAASVVLHGLFLVAVAYVPSLQSLMRVAGDLTGIEFVDEDYDKSLVGQRATLIKLEPYRKLYYPEGYFITESPLAPLSPDDPVMLARASAPTPPPRVIKPIYTPPPRVIKPLPTPSASPTPEASPSPEVAQATPSPEPGASPTPDAEAQQAEAELDKIAAENGTPRPPRVNTRPFKDIAQKGKEMVDTGSINLSGTIDASVEAERNEDGSLKRETVKIEGLASDDKMALLAQEFINALSESKVLGILKGAEHIKMTLKLDQQNVAVRIVTEVGTEDDASKMAKGYGLLLAIARKKKAETEEGELYKNLNVSSDGKQFLITFEMPRDAAGKMIAEMLAKQKLSG